MLGTSAQRDGSQRDVLFGDSVGLDSIAWRLPKMPAATSGEWGSAAGDLPGGFLAAGGELGRASLPWDTAPASGPCFLESSRLSHGCTRRPTPASPTGEGGAGFWGGVGRTVTPLLDGLGGETLG